MAYEDKTGGLSVGEQGPSPDLLREMLGKLVQETIRSEFDRFMGAEPYETARQHVVGIATGVGRGVLGPRSAPLSVF